MYFEEKKIQKCFNPKKSQTQFSNIFHNFWHLSPFCKERLAMWKNKRKNRNSSFCLEDLANPIKTQNLLEHFKQKT